MYNIYMYIVCNWKTYVKTREDAEHLAKAFVSFINKLNGRKLILCPSDTHIATVYKETSENEVSIAAQDINPNSQGPVTAGVSPNSVRDAGATYTLLGHAETRRAGVTLEDINIRIKSANKHGLIPIVCLTETKTNSKEEIVSSLETILKDCEASEVTNCIFAYEPVENIGADGALTSSEIGEVVDAVKAHMKERFNLDSPVLYGGSVDSNNYEEVLTAAPDGVLLGRAGTNASIVGEMLSIL